MPLLDFQQPFFIETNPAFVTVRLALQLEAALLRSADLALQLREPFAQAPDFILPAQHLVRKGVNFDAQIFSRGVSFAYPHLTQVNLVARDLGVEMRQHDNPLWI